jgi:Flp pilus assembly protein TadB
MVCFLQVSHCRYCDSSALTCDEAAGVHVQQQSVDAVYLVVWMCGCVDAVYLVLLLLPDMHCSMCMLITATIVTVPALLVSCRLRRRL